MTYILYPAPNITKKMLQENRTPNNGSSVHVFDLWFATTIMDNVEAFGTSIATLLKQHWQWWNHMLTKDVN